MKTKFFKSGFCAKLALAVVAMTTAMFSSCSNEDIAFDVTPAAPVNAKAYLDVVVVAGGVDVTSKAVLTFSQQPINANGLRYFEGNPDLSAISLTVSATYEGMTGSTPVMIPALTAGTSYATVAKVFLSYPVENLVEEAVSSSVKIEEVENATEVTSFENTSDYAITKTIKYIDIEGSKVIENDYTGNDENVWNMINKFNMPYTETLKTFTFEVPAYSIVTPEIKTVKTVQTYNINWTTRAANTVATFVVEDYSTTVSIGVVSIAHGDDHGHGHGHGDGSNAGGGIVNND